MPEIDNLIELVHKAPKPKPDPRALSAYRHGITGHVRFFACPEEEAAFHKHCDGYATTWTPAGAVESDLCHRLADTAWRLGTVAAMENAIQAEALSQPVVRHCGHEQADIALEYSRIWKDSGNQLDLLSRYERRLQRNYNELLDNLKEVQALRRAAEKEKELAAQRAATEAALKASQAATAARMQQQFDNLRSFQVKPASPPPPASAQPDFSREEAIMRAAADHLKKFDFSKKSVTAASPAPTPPRS